MKYISLIALVLAFLLGWGCTPVPKTEAAATPATETKPDPVMLASPGRIEGLTETIEVGAAIDGVLTAVHVKEGEEVKKDTLLAELGCQDIRATLRTAMSEFDSYKQVRARLVRGSRDEERLAATQRTRAAKAVLEQANTHLRRTKDLVAASVAARSLLDEAQRDYDVAEAHLKEALRQEELVNAPPVTEDLAKADADVTSAENRVVSLSERLSKCAVRAPITGTVLRILLWPGESFSTLAPKPLFLMSDLSGRRVRAEVDEKDVMKVWLGQRAMFTSDANPDRKFLGTVSRVSPTMGRKRISSGDPAEKADRDVLEVMVDLDQAANQLPVGLRVVVRFTDEAPAKASPAPADKPKPAVRRKRRSPRKTEEVVDVSQPKTARNRNTSARPAVDPVP